MSPISFDIESIGKGCDFDCGGVCTDDVSASFSECSSPNPRYDSDDDQDSGGDYYTTHGPQLIFNLGNISDDEGAGTMVIKMSGSPDDYLLTTSALQLFLNDAIDDATHVLRDVNGELLQIWTGEHLIDFQPVLNTSSEQVGFEVIYYDASAKDGDTLVNGRYKIFAGSIPVLKVVIEKVPTGLGDFNYRMTQYDENNIVTRVDEAFWDEATETWGSRQGLDVNDPDNDTTTPSTSRSGEIDEGGDWVSTEVTTIKVDDGNGGLVDEEVSKTQTTLRDFDGFGWQTVKQVQDPDGEALTTRWSYEDNPDNDGYGQMILMVSPTGYWERYVYDGNNVLSHTIRQVGTNVYDPATDLAVLEAANAVSYFTGTKVQLFGGMSVEEDVVYKKTEVKIAGDTESVSYTVYRGTSSIADTTETWTIRGATEDPEAAAGSTVAFLESMINDTDTAGHQVSKSWQYVAGYTGTSGGEEYDPVQSESPNGDMTFYTYDAERLVGNPIVGQTLVSRGMPFTPDGSVIMHGTRTWSYKSPATGKTLRSMTERNHQNGGWFVESASIIAARDADDRVLKRYTYHGADALQAFNDAEALQVAEGLEDITGSLPANPSSSSESIYDCCYLIGQIDRQGIQTDYEYDQLGRRHVVTRAVHTSGELETMTVFDALGRQKQSLREGVVTAESAYDTLGRVTWQQNAAGDTVYYTTRFVDASGSTFVPSYDPAAATEVYYTESRVYPHDANSGPVQVAWSDSQGRSVLAYTAPAPGSATWSTASLPAADLALGNVYSRVETYYDAEGGVSESRTFHTLTDGQGQSLTGLQALATPGAPGTNYIVQTDENIEDFFGRTLRTKDQAGNIAVTVYDSEDRPVETWVGTDDGNSTNDPSYDYSNPGSLGDLVQVSWQEYNEYNKLRFSRRLKSVSAISDFYSDSTETEHDEIYQTQNGALINREVHTNPNFSGGLPRIQRYDQRGRLTLAHSLSPTGVVVSQTENLYDDSSSERGRLQASRVYATGGKESNADYLETTYHYDDAGRQVRTTQPTGAFNLSLYDDLGRVKSSLLCASDGGTELDPSDDVVATEQIYIYDEVDRVVFTVSLERKHDADDQVDIGRLWDEVADAPTPFAEARYTATWYDKAGRVTHTADYGNVRPGS